MAARTSLLSKRRPHTRATLADLYGTLPRALAVVLVRPVVTAASRRTRARLGMLGVPLAITASLIAGLWWLVLPLAVCASWWSPRYTGLEWLRALGRGVVGAVWALTGSRAFASFPDHVLTVGAFWLLGAGLLVGGSSVLARRVPHTSGRGEQRQRNGVQMRLTGVPSVRRRFAMHLTIHKTPPTREKRQ
jgi:hypothetical protein